MPYAAIITGIISTGIKLLGSAGGPDYPDTPKLAKIPIQKAKKFMENYERKRMGASIAAWQKRFPLLYSGGQYMVEDIARNQQGRLSPTISAALTRSGLDLPIEGNQYAMAKDLGLSPITLSQRTSEAVTRQIAQNPEWTDRISGGTLATMIANNYQNQNAFAQFLGANQTAQYVAGQAMNAQTTRALLTGLTGSAAIGMRAYQNANSPLNPSNYYAPGAPLGSSPASNWQPNMYQGAVGGYTPSASVGPLEDVQMNPAYASTGYGNWYPSNYGNSGSYYGNWIIPYDGG